MTPSFLLCWLSSAHTPLVQNYWWILSCRGQLFLVPINFLKHCPLVLCSLLPPFYGLFLTLCTIVTLSNSSNGRGWNPPFPSPQEPPFLVKIPPPYILTPFHSWKNDHACPLKIISPIFFPSLYRSCMCLGSSWLVCRFFSPPLPKFHMGSDLPTPSPQKPSALPTPFLFSHKLFYVHHPMELCNPKILSFANFIALFIFVVWVFREVGIRVCVVFFFSLGSPLSPFYFTSTIASPSTSAHPFSPLWDFDNGN